jgi:hypothetical protein
VVDLTKMGEDEYRQHLLEQAAGGNNPDDIEIARDCILRYLDVVIEDLYGEDIDGHGHYIDPRDLRREVLGEE